MFGGHIEVHSILGDLWVGFGFFGLWTAGYLVFWILKGMAQYFSSASALLSFIAVATYGTSDFRRCPRLLLKAVLAFCLLLPVAMSPRSDPRRV